MSIQEEIQKSIRENAIIQTQMMPDQPSISPDVKYVQYVTDSQYIKGSIADELQQLFFSIDKDLNLGNNDDMNIRSIYRHYRCAVLARRANWMSMFYQEMMTIKVIIGLHRSKDGFTQKQMTTSRKEVVSSNPSAQQVGGLRSIIKRFGF